MEALPERRQATIEGAWLDKSEAEPGDTVTVNVQLRPYRGSPVIRDVQITIPPQAIRGTSMQILASDSSTLNRMSVVSGSQASLHNLEQLISVLNRERRNNRLYVTLLGPSPTMVVQDKVMPNVPASQINLLDQRGGPANSQVVRESAAGEWSLPLDQVVQGPHPLRFKSSKRQAGARRRLLEESHAQFIFNCRDSRGARIRRVRVSPRALVTARRDGPRGRRSRACRAHALVAAKLV